MPIPTLTRQTLMRLGAPAAGILVSTALIALFARGIGGGWLGFVVLLPWLLTLDARASWRATLASAALMAVGYTVAALGWFAEAVAGYTGAPVAATSLLLVLAAPLLQTQFLAFALLRRALASRLGWFWLAVASAGGWVGCEWLLPKLLGDTLGHGLVDALLLRQAADLGGAGLLSFALLLSNLALAEALSRRQPGWRARLLPALIAVGLPLLLLGYGHFRIGNLASAMNEPVPELRIGMIQSGITDYAALRAEHGSWGAVRQVLDRHFQLSQAAIEQHGAEALLWSETVYPTPFGHPKSEDGAAFDAEIRAFVESRGLPLVFGTYDVDAAGEYNAAAFLDPAAGLLGYYRKTHPFPLTEHVPPWLDGPTLRHWLPWAGSWQPGNGPRVLPLRSADGRSLEVLPLICLDAVRPGLALEGTRLGAQALVVLSNDAWFNGTPMGARLHLAVSRFRSIETRLPQLRVTPNGISAFIDPSGEVLAATGLGDQAVLAGPVPIRAPPATLMVRWGDWFGGFALGLALLGALVAGSARLRSIPVPAAATISDPRQFTSRVALVGPRLRIVMAALRIGAAAGLLWLLVRMFTVDGLQVNNLLQLQIYGAAVLAPLLLHWLLRQLAAAQLSIDGEDLRLQQRHRRIQIPIRNIVAVEPWRVALPMGGVHLRLASGKRAPIGLVDLDPLELSSVVRMLGAAMPMEAKADGARLRAEFMAARRNARRHWLDHGALRFGLFPLLLAIPAFRLHQLIAFGGSFGEWQTFGFAAYLKGFLIWWGAWSLGTMLTAAALRVLIDTSCLAGRYLAPTAIARWRRSLEWSGRIAFYALIPAWLFWRVLLS